jgi:hypothetical protein
MLHLSELRGAVEIGNPIVYASRFRLVGARKLEEVVTVIQKDYKLLSVILAVLGSFE